MTPRGATTSLKPGCLPFRLAVQFAPSGYTGAASMSSPGSVTYWIHQLPAGDQAAIQKLWERYFPRLVGLVRKRLMGAPRAADDEEDVALSAFNSFFRRAQEGRFPKLTDRD